LLLNEITYDFFSLCGVNAFLSSDGYIYIYACVCHTSLFLCKSIYDLADNLKS
jgi:hypothetical protein